MNNDVQILTTDINDPKEIKVMLFFLKHIMNILKKKNAEYSSERSFFHNFEVAGEIQGTNPPKAIGGHLSKHIVSIYDIINKDPNAVSAEVLDEKIGDAINYLLILRAWYVFNKMPQKQPE